MSCDMIESSSLSAYLELGYSMCCLERNSTLSCCYCTTAATFTIALSICACIDGDKFMFIFWLLMKVIMGNVGNHYIKQGSVV